MTDPKPADVIAWGVAMLDLTCHLCGSTIPEDATVAILRGENQLYGCTDCRPMPGPRHGFEEVFCDG